MQSYGSSELDELLGLLEKMLETPALFRKGMPNYVIEKKGNTIISPLKKMDLSEIGSVWENSSFDSGSVPKKDAQVRCSQAASQIRFHLHAAPKQCSALWDVLVDSEPGAHPSLCTCPSPLSSPPRWRHRGCHEKGPPSVYWEFRLVHYLLTDVNCISDSAIIIRMHPTCNRDDDTTDSGRSPLSSFAKHLAISGGFLYLPVKMAFARMQQL